MKYVVIALLALILGGLIGHAIWAEKKEPAVDPVHPEEAQVHQRRHPQAHVIDPDEHPDRHWMQLWPAYTR